MTKVVNRETPRLRSQPKMKPLSQTKRPVMLTADAATRAKIEVLMLRDGLDLETFLARATESYALVMPGWPYLASRR